MFCEKCKRYIEFSKEYNENIIDKYVLTLYKTNYRENDYKLCILFNRLIDYIKENEDLEIFKSFNNKIKEEFIIKCERCEHINNFSYSIYFPNEFYSFIIDYINFTLENLIKTYTNKNLSDFSISINQDNIDIFFEYFPEQNKIDYYLIKKLFYVKNILPLYGEFGGGGQELLEWLLDEFKVQIFGIMLSLIITGGLDKIKELVKNIKVKHEIRKRIKIGNKYWKDIDIEDIKKYISIPKNYKESKEELIEEILKIKFEEYKNEIIEKLR